VSVANTDCDADRNTQLDTNRNSYGDSNRYAYAYTLRQRAYPKRWI
jgi:hypothetical protein